MSGRTARVAAVCGSAALTLAGCGGGGGGGTAAAVCSGTGGPKVAVKASVRPAGVHVWSGAVSARPGEMLQHRLDVMNLGGGQALHTTVRVRLRDGESAVLASAYIQRLGVAVSNASPLPSGLFGHGVKLGPLPGCGTHRVILFDTRAGGRSYNEPASVRWNGGRVRSNVRVTIAARGA